MQEMQCATPARAPVPRSVLHEHADSTRARDDNSIPATGCADAFWRSCVASFCAWWDRWRKFGEGFQSPSLFYSPISTKIEFIYFA